MDSLLPQLKKGFDSEETFRQRQGETYSLLPFRFIALDEARYVVTNFVGEYLVLSQCELEDVVRHRLSATSDLYAELKSRHFLIDNDSNVALDLLACKYRTKQSLLSDLTSLFLFVVSLRCEHSCPYCQVSRQSTDRSAYDMTREHAAKAIDFVFASPSDNVKVEFQGGEPLLNFDLIRWAVCEIESRNSEQVKNIGFVITTNLALIDDTVLEFCKEHDVHISTSLDGPQSLHNQNRPRPGNNSYELAVAGIAQSREALGHERVSAIMTTTKASLSQPEAIIDEYVRQGFSSIFLRPLSPFGFAVKTGAIEAYSSEEWFDFYKKSIRYILDLNLAGHDIVESYSALILTRILTCYPTGYVDLQSPAGAGIGCLAFNYDGSVYASDEARMLAEMSDETFRLGHLDEDTFSDILTSENLWDCLEQTFTESMPMCSDCGFQPYCGSDPVYHHATQGDVVGRKPESGFCSKNMAIFRYLIGLLEDDPQAKEILTSWVH